MQQRDGGLLFLLGGETQEEQKAQALASPRTSQADALPSSSAYGNKENQLQGPPPAISRGCRRRKWNNQWIINIPHKAGASSRPLPGVLRTAATRAGAGVAGCHGAGKTCGGHAGGTIPLLGAHWVGERMEQRKTMLWLPLGTIRAAPCLCRRAVCGLQWQRTSLLGHGDRVSLYLQQARSAGMPRGRPSAMDLIPFSGVS